MMSRIQSCRCLFNHRILHKNLLLGKNTTAYCYFGKTYATFRNKFVHSPLRSHSKYNLSYHTFEEDPTLTISQEIHLLSELNQASVSTLQEYGLDNATAIALNECKPITNITKLENLPGMDKETIQAIYKKCSQVSNYKMEPLRPLLSVLKLPGCITSVTITQGCICYCQLSLSDLKTKSQSDSEAPVVELLDVDLLPIETSDSKLHPNKLLLKVEKVLKMLPSADVYVMPNAQYDNFQRNLSAQDISVKRQLAQITGMVQGHLATTPSDFTPPLYYLRDSFVHSLFGLKVVGNAVTSSLPLLHHLLQGELVQTAAPLQVPKLRVSGTMYDHCKGQTEHCQHTLAPTLYTSLAFCALLHRALCSTPL